MENKTKNRSAYFKKWRSENMEKTRAYGLKWYYANKDKAVLKRERQKLREYGISIEDYTKLLEIQNGLCAICEKACTSGRKLAVDHSHSTNKVRGLLCGNCNQGLGKFFDNKELLQKAIEYLSS